MAIMGPPLKLKTTATILTKVCNTSVVVSGSKWRVFSTRRPYKRHWFGPFRGPTNATFVFCHYKGKKQSKWSRNSENKKKERERKYVQLGKHLQSVLLDANEYFSEGYSTKDPVYKATNEYLNDFFINLEYWTLSFPKGHYNKLLGKKYLMEKAVQFDHDLNLVPRKSFADILFQVLVRWSLIYFFCFFVILKTANN